MALALSPELLAAQTAQVRKPIIEITAGQLQSDYPFTGNAISNPDSQIQGASLPIFLSDGKLGIFYTGKGYWGDRRQLRYVVTDADRTVFSDYVVVDEDTNYAFDYIDGILLPDGNIGVVAQLYTGNLAFYRVSPTGIKLSETQKTGLVTLRGVTVVYTGSQYVAIFIRYYSGVYTFYKCTSTDFVTWSTPTSFAIPGLTSTDEVFSPRIKKLNDATYKIVFSRTVNTISNIYSSESTDVDIWSTIFAVTSNTNISKDITNPHIVQKLDGSEVIAFENNDAYLRIPMGAGAMFIDTAANMLYVTVTGAWYPQSEFGYGCFKYDLSTLELVKSYTQFTSLPIPSWFLGANRAVYNTINEGIAPLYINGAVCIVDFNNDQIRSFYLQDYSVSYGETAKKNVNADWSFLLYYDGVIRNAEVVDNKLWLSIDNGYIYNVSRTVLCYIDLTDTTAPYELVIVNKCDSALWRTGQLSNSVSFHPDLQLATVASQDGYIDWQSPLLVVSLEENSTIKCYAYDQYNDFPFMGVTYATIVDGEYIFAVPRWSSVRSADANKWGLLRINISTDQMDYFYPPWITSAGNYFYNATVDEDSKKIMLRTWNGVAIFNYELESWVRLDSDTDSSLPVVSHNAYTEMWGLAYDNVNKLLFYGDNYNLFVVPESGILRSLLYLKDGEISSLATGYSNTVPMLAVSPEDEIYATWSNTAAIDTVYWDKEGAVKNLSRYLTDETKLSWSIEDPGSVSFSLTHGHLFDPHNVNSLLRTYIAKGKSIRVRAGENISDSASLVYQGVFVVTGVSISFKRGEYPIIRVEAKDKRYLWGLHQVTTCAITSMTPEYALVDILMDHTGEDASNISISSFPLSFSFDAYWTDQTVADIVEDIAHRFQQFPLIQHDGSISFRGISLDDPSSLAISPSMLISFQPNDESSDLTNRITVTGESLDDFQVTYAEEKIASRNGTIGWWGYKNDFRIPYSDDETATYLDPRLVTIESASGVLFQLAGKITESITTIDPFNKYCIVTVKAPNLIPLLVSGIATYFSGNKVGDWVVSWLGGITIPLGRLIEGAGMMLCLAVLGSVANFQYEIYGRPVGYVKRTYQASADDEELQTELGFVVENKIEGFLCHTPSHCRTVADFEMAIAKAERKKATVEIVSHLQLEIGDTITVTHPYTRQDVKLFITSLTRTYSPATISGEGRFIDTIEGWVL